MSEPTFLDSARRLKQIRVGPMADFPECKGDFAALINRLAYATGGTRQLTNNHIAGYWAVLKEFNLGVTTWAVEELMSECTDHVTAAQIRRRITGEDKHTLGRTFLGHEGNMVHGDHNPTDEQRERVKREAAELIASLDVNARH